MFASLFTTLVNPRRLFQLNKGFCLRSVSVTDILTNFSTSKMAAVNGDSALFTGKEDRFKGITVDSKSEPCEGGDLFKAKLECSIKEWQQKKVRGLWFNVHLAQSDWIPELARQGFDFHHASAGCVSMIRWLPEEETCQVPPYAHHMVGVGAMVVNEQDELLVVEERFSVIKHWKLPGGYVDPGEDLAAAATREVKEETGIDAEFQSILAFRHVHGTNFGCSDIYVIVVLKPLTREINHCKREIKACTWMKLSDYLNSDIVHDTNKFFANKFLEGRKNGVSIGCDDIELKIKEFRRMQKVYSIKSAGQNSDQ